jgi:regulator of replication initiation timing
MKNTDIYGENHHLKVENIKLKSVIEKLLIDKKALQEQLTLTDVSQRSKLLFAFEEYWNTNNCDGENFGNVVDRFLANNCG